MLGAFILASGCSTPAPKSRPDLSTSPAPRSPSAGKTTPAPVKLAQDLEARGDYQGAVREYQRLASAARGDRQIYYQLLAARSLVRGNFTDQAKRLVDSIRTENLSDERLLQRQIVLAMIDLAEHHPENALLSLSLVPSPDVGLELQREYFQLRAQAYQASDKPLSAVETLVQLDKLLPPGSMKEENNALIWKLIVGMSTQTLAKLSLPPPPNTVSGWIELGRLYKSAGFPSVRLDQEVPRWQQRYPNHPAPRKLLDTLITLQQDKTFRPTHIALLLPASGRFAGSAEAIRDGFLTAFYLREDRYAATTIRIYDTGDPVLNVSQAYDQAVADGAEIIIGPLRKPAVDELAQREQLPIPTIALNYAAVADQPPPKNLFQFGLSPEDEARQVAEKAWLDGYNEAIALVPQGDWGSRLLNAFWQHWRNLGGTLVEYQTYPNDTNDFSAPLRSLLNIDDSHARRQRLEQVIGKKVHFEPQRRTDVDFIFIAALPRHARQIRPQLKFYYAADLPIYATSHVFSGKVSPEKDRDMNDVMFCDIPLILNPDTPGQQLWRQARRLWPDKAEPYQRLYALGFDAHSLLSNLRRMSLYRFEHIPGETGRLSLDDANRIHRQLAWAQFRKGVPQPLEPQHTVAPDPLPVSPAPLPPTTGVQ